MSEVPPLELPEQDEQLESVVVDDMPKATVESVQEELTKLKEVNGKPFFVALDASNNRDFQKIVNEWELRQTRAYKVPNAESSEPSAAIIYTSDKNICIQISPAEEIDPMDFVEHVNAVPEDTRIMKFPERRVITISNSPNIDRVGYEIENPKGITVSTSEILEIASR